MKLRLLILILSLAFATEATAQWQQTAGPYGGTVSSFAKTADGFVAVIGQDLYQYNNSTWTLKQENWKGQLFQMGDIILSAHVESAKVSTNGGESWQDTKLPSDHVAIQHNTFLSPSRDSLYESSDGINWTFRALLPTDPVSFTVNHGSLFCFSGWTGLMRSDNGGHTWELLPNQPPFQITLKWVSTGSALYAMPYPSGIYRTTDNGATWEAMNRNLYEGTIFEGVAQSGDDLFVSDWRTTYRLVNDNWIEVPVAKIQASLIAGGTLFMATESGVISFRDNTFTSLSGGAIATNVTRLGSTGSTLFAKTDAGVFRTRNNGQSWDLNLNGYAEDIATAKGSVLIRGTSIMRSIDNGDTWVNIDPAFDEFIVSPTRLIEYQGDLYLTSGLVFAGEHGSGAGWTTGGVYRSSDGGESWYDISTNLPHNGVTHVPVFNIVGANGRLLIQTADGIFIKVPESQSWGRVSLGSQGQNIMLFSAGEKFMMVLDSNWFVSDNGDRWEPLVADAPEDFMRNYEYVYSFSSVRGIPYITTMRSVKRDSTHYDYIFRSFKLVGSRWIEITDELPQNTITTTMIEHNGELFAATSTRGVWKSALPQASVEVVGTDDQLPVYPNPAITYLNVSGNVEAITNELGQDVTNMTTVTTGRLDISRLAAGAYHIQTDTGSARFIKQ